MTRSIVFSQVLLSLVAFLPSLHSKSLNEYLQLSLGIERATKFLEQTNPKPSHHGKMFVTEEEDEGVISIGCGSYANGGVAGLLLFSLINLILLSSQQPNILHPIKRIS
jgi:hypothetical protein